METSPHLPPYADQRLVKDTVYINEPNFILPQKSEVRRRLFQDLQNRYYRQILYGCRNPHCETPTCLSCQKRISKGPFRPYTSLSARSLAAFLASEQHPERGLCPHEPIKLGNLAALRTNEEARSQESSSSTRHPHGGSVVKPTQTASSEIFLKNSDVSISTPSQKQDGSEGLKTSVNQSDNDGVTLKDKDYKSFTQILFDTAAMRSLQSTSTQHIYSSRQAEDRDDHAAGAAHESGLHAAQSLSHFTLENIEGLMTTMEQNHQDMFEQHKLLRSLGRRDPPCDLSLNVVGYRDLLTFISQSMTYILSNIDTMMQSFLHWEDTRASKKIVWSYNFPLLIHCFRNLRSLDFAPMCMFSSLWISAGQLYPVNSHRKKPTNVNVGLKPLAALDYSEDEIEFAHLTKTVFAFLVGSVPKCDREVLKLVSRLRAVGRASPWPGETDKRLVKKLLSTLAMFENQSALNLVTRLVKAIAARHHTMKMWFETDPRFRKRLGGCINIFLLTIRYIYTERMDIEVANNDTILSVKDGVLNFPNEPEISEHLEKPFRVLIEWLRSVILKDWDGQTRFPKCSAVCGALELLGYISDLHWLKIEPEVFYTPFISDRLEILEAPSEWINAKRDTASMHILSYPFLFPPSVLVSYFRAINYAAMYKAFESAALVENTVRRMTFTDSQTRRGELRLQDRLKRAQDNYLVIEVRREQVLTDAMNQLWRRQKRELMRPLKVRIVGEEGVDHGGVQQEFFRIAIAEAMDPAYGAFTTDPQTHMSWFQPGSLEPLYKFELLGLLVSLAVYNGLTLPFTFPRVLYHKLLGYSSLGLRGIEDGWPILAKSLEELRDWPNDDVEEVFMRPYVFSVEVFGTTVDVDMDKARKAHLRRLKEQERRQKEKEARDQEESPNRPTKKKGGTGKVSRTPPATLEDDGQNMHSQEVNGKETESDGSEAPLHPSNDSENDCSSEGSNSSDDFEAFHESRLSPGVLPRTRVHPDSEPIMVTNENRENYIEDYILNLTHMTIRRQFSAFREGFFTCIAPLSINFFSSTALKVLVEGLPDIDVDALQRVTTYEGGYDLDHPTIRSFWEVVRSWDQEKVRKLLEFVTASDRLPVGGVSRLVFAIQKNGTGDDRLPTSSTCFGRLLLPEYDSEERLKEVLELAVEHSKGFGQP